MEKSVETYLKKKIQLKGGLCIKFFPLGFTGFPDRMIFLPGLFCLVETKDPKGLVKKRQEFVHKQLRSYGIIVHVIKTKIEVDEIFGS